jgi:hypothetical protein
MQEVPDLMGKFAHTLADRVNYELQNRGVIPAKVKLGTSGTEALPAKGDSSDDE